MDTLSYLLNFGLVLRYLLNFGLETWGLGTEQIFSTADSAKLASAAVTVWHQQQSVKLSSEAAKFETDDSNCSTDPTFLPQTARSLKVRRKSHFPATDSQKSIGEQKSLGLYRL